MITSVLTTSHANHICFGCPAVIWHGSKFLEHKKVEDGEVEFLSECIPCARRNGRAEVAEPDVAEQPLDLEGIA